jgi:hypothetical protein
LSIRVHASSTPYAKGDSAQPKACPKQLEQIRHESQIAAITQHMIEKAERLEPAKSSAEHDNS